MGMEELLDFVQGVNTRRRVRTQRHGRRCRKNCLPGTDCTPPASVLSCGGWWRPFNDAHTIDRSFNRAIHRAVTTTTTTITMSYYYYYYHHYNYGYSYYYPGD